MSFTSVQFAAFFVIVLLVLIITAIPKLSGFMKPDVLRNFRNAFLLAASYVFCGWWDRRFALLLAILTLIAYGAAKGIHSGRRTTFWKVVGVAVPLVILGIFKYYNFFLETFCELFRIQDFSTLKLILPIGISFYTFQAISYVLDVAAKKLPPASLLEVSLYMAFFPKLISGPLVKAADFIPQFRENRNISLKNFEEGIQIFVLGLFRKMVLADHISVFTNDVFATPRAFSSITVIWAVIGYALQIYFDFAGYSDMAIGCAKCMGYDINRNFNLPYISKNPTEFWKRWHISLSAWLQEYLYIMLGGNRKGKVRTYANLLLTMILGGLWHGSEWTFVAWGLLHGLALCLHKMFRTLLHIPKNKQSTGVFAVVSAFLNFCFAALCWVFFKAENFSTAMEVFKKVFIWTDGVQQPFFWVFVGIILELFYLTYCKLKSGRGPINSYYPKANLNSFWGLTLFFLAVMITIGLAYTGASPFIYFQF